MQASIILLLYEGVFMSEHFDLKSDGFYTLRGYARVNSESITYAMEDYLEMIFRLYNNDEVIRIKKLSETLHVKPSSASKMANLLKQEDLIDFKKYGQITLTEKGKVLGEYLLFRHNILQRFFCHINHTEDELALVEKIEHYIDDQTIYNIKNWLDEKDH